MADRNEGRSEQQEPRVSGGKTGWQEASESPARAPMTDAEKKGHDLLGGSGPRDGAISGPSGVHGVTDAGRDRSEEARQDDRGAGTNRAGGDVGSRQADGN